MNQTFPDPKSYIYFLHVYLKEMNDICKQKTKRTKGENKTPIRIFKVELQNALLHLVCPLVWTIRYGKKKKRSAIIEDTTYLKQSKVDKIKN